MDRRKLLKGMIAAAVAMRVAPYTVANSITLPSCSPFKIPQRKFGKTGRQVGIYGLGGQGAIEQLSCEDKAIGIINRAIDLGVNYIDTSAFYGQDGWDGRPQEYRGISERRIGQVMKNRRKEVFLASKTLGRTYDAAMRDLEKSLNNLQTDRIDLWQVHAFKEVEYSNKETYKNIQNGVFKAMRKAKEEGIVNHIGITGHQEPLSMKNTIIENPELFDGVLMPLNPADKYRKSFIENLLPTTVENELGIIGMKIPARGRIFSHGGIITMKESMSYVLSLPVSTIIVGIDEIEELEENIKIANEFVPLTEEEMFALEERTKPYEKDITFYKDDNYQNWPYNSTLKCN